ncbi:MAG: class I SAM-dependent methyltransferase [Gammaproteobacteria bacterium]|nr:class I SAM-dependent methyltransferase [Gammaproteobacteria bacterium]
MDVHCPLCHFEKIQPYYQNKGVSYLSCGQCDLVFIPKAYHLSDSEEKLRYDAHHNNPDDRRYQAFLSQVFDPVMAHIGASANGLDFGSGPGPTLSLMFEKQGHQVDLFDKFYANNPTIFSNQYDFITATEVFEHLSDPKFELNRLFSTLKKGGVLAIMTQMITKEVDFSTWYYKNDPTHICFFSKQTMRYLAQQWGVKVKFFANNVVLFVS